MLLCLNRMATAGTNPIIGGAAQAPRHIPELDGIRGIAVLMVLFFHAFSWKMELQHWTGVAHIVDRITSPGWLGVDLFFVLSGFLITSILLDQKGRPRYFLNFYMRRMLRILPAYYGMLILIALYYPHSAAFVGLSFLYCSNISSLFGVHTVYGPLWSLSVEEHFYMLWPLVVSRTSRRTLAIICMLVCAASPIARSVGFHLDSDIFAFTWFRLDGLSYGALLAAFTRSRYYSRSNLLKLSASAIALFLFIVAGGGSRLLTRANVLGASLQYTCFEVLSLSVLAFVLANGGSPITAVLRWKPLTYCGSVSYFVYLFHWFALGLYEKFWAVRRENFGDIVLRAAFGIALTFFVAHLSYRYFESPILRLKKHFQ